MKDLGERLRQVSRDATETRKVPMQNAELPWWVLKTLIFHDDDDDDGDDGGDGNEGDDGDDDGEEGEDEDGEGGSGGNGGDTPEARLEALEKALKEERRLRRKAEREARRASKKKADSEEQQTAEEAKAEAQAAGEKVTRLATRLRTSSVDNAIIEAARDMGFIDPTDALRDDVRNQVDVDQDDEDPSDIDIDLDTVRDAVKKLATKKKHLVGTAGGGTRSGGKFRKGQGGDSEDADQQSLLGNYPALRG